jgi:VWFA-related protein
MRASSPRRPSFPRLVPLLAPLLALAGFAASGLAQPSPLPATSFSEAIDVDVVNLEVFVADRSGRPVTGLAQGDFELLVDGKPVAITNFYAAAGGSGGAGGRSGGSPGGKAGGLGGAPAADGGGDPRAAAAPAGDDRRLNLAIFVDNLNLTVEARNQALQSLDKFFRAGLRRDDRVILASYDGRAVKLRRPPAGDGAAAAAALAEVAGGRSHGELTSAEERKGFQDLGNASSAAEASAAIEQLNEVGRERQGDAHTLLVTLARFVDSLAGLRGRKALLYVTGILAASEGDTFLADLVRRANAAGVTLYALGAPMDLASLALQTTKADFLGPLASNARGDDLRSTLESVTFPTGGLTGVDLNRPAVLLDHIRDDFASYYSLGFAPPGSPDGSPSGAVEPRPHRLQVRVRGRRGLTVRFPASFLPRSRDQRLADRTAAALLVNGVDNPLEVRLGFERDELAAYGQRQVTVLVTVPFSRLTLRPGQGAHEGSLTLFLTARDSAGHELRMRRIAIPVHVPDGELAAALGKRVAHRVRLELPPGASTIALGARDELGSRESAVTAKYVAGALSTAAVAPR